MSIEKHIVFTDEHVSDGDCGSVEASITVRNSGYECPFVITVDCSTVYVDERGLGQLSRLLNAAKLAYKRDLS